MKVFLRSFWLVGIILVSFLLGLLINIRGINGVISSFYSYTGGIFWNSTSTGTFSLQPSSISKTSDFLLFEEAYETIVNNFYGFNTVNSKDIITGMIRGATQALGDKHTEYFNTEETKKFNEMLSWDFEGIGAVVNKMEIGVEVSQVLAGSPAKEAGIFQWDILIKANDEPLDGIPLTDAISKIRGAAGTSVKLEILRAGEKSSIIKTVIRRKIEVPSVSGKMLEGTKIGYIALSIFGEKTASDFKKTLDSLKKDGANGIIIDLRDNGGGLLSGAVEILSEFVGEGRVLVTTKEKNPFLNQSYFSNGKKDVSIPVVLLVNGNSASASEIMAWALKDYKLALIVWEKTYGKGSVQQPFILSDGSEIKLTVAKWYTPLDHGIDKVGIEPDVNIKFQKEDYEKKYDRQLEESKKVIEKLLKKEGFDRIISEYKQQLEDQTLSTTGSGSSKK